MSGGSLGNYGFHQCEYAAEDLRSEIARNGQPDEDGYERDPWMPETLNTFGMIADLLDAAAQAWRDADWLISGDTSEDNWLSDETCEVPNREQQIVDVKTLLAPIIEKNRDQIGTHGPDCWQWHHGCLAVAVMARIGGHDA